MIDDKKLVFCFALAAAAAAALGGCTSAPETEAAAESVTSELSRCGARPRVAAGCTARCECSGPVTGPYGETEEDYECTPLPGGGQDCRLRVPRGDCSWNVTCEGQEEPRTPPRRPLGGRRVGTYGTYEPVD